MIKKIYLQNVIVQTALKITRAISWYHAFSQYVQVSTRHSPKDFLVKIQFHLKRICC